MLPLIVRRGTGTCDLCQIKKNVAWSDPKVLIDKETELHSKYRHSFCLTIWNRRIYMSEN